MKPVALRMLAVTLALACLAGCVPRRRGEPAIPQPEMEMPAPALPTPSPTPAPTAALPARSTEQRLYGSAGLLAWPCVLYSVYLDEAGGAAWSEEEIARSQQNLALAVDWITDQAAEYGVTPTLYAGEEDLVIRMRYAGTFAGGQSADESETFYRAAEALCEELDTETLTKTYGTSNIGFLLFLPVAGCSFTMVHYLEDGDAYYHEYSCLYRENAFFPEGTFETPAVYAHEILHLFGAPDLYDRSNDLFVTPALVDYVETSWPDAIMQDTYNADGSLDYEAVDKIICPLTAYRLGLCATFAGIEQFPAAAADPPGTFRLDPQTDPALYRRDDLIAAAPPRASRHG